MRYNKLPFKLMTHSTLRCNRWLIQQVFSERTSTQGFSDVLRPISAYHRQPVRLKPKHPHWLLRFLLQQITHILQRRNVMSTQQDSSSHVTNDEVLRRVQENRNILDTVQQHKLRWIGHILRHDSLLRDIMGGRMLGKSTRGWKRLQMLSDITSKDYVTLDERCRRQKQLAEKFVINLLYSKDQRAFWVCTAVLPRHACCILLTESRQLAHT